MRKYIIAFMGVIFSMMCYANPADDQAKNAALVEEIITTENDCVTWYGDDRIYIDPDKVFITKEGLFLNVGENRFVLVPSLYSDAQGCYIRLNNDCKVHHHCTLCNGEKSKGSLKCKNPSCFNSKNSEDASALVTTLDTGKSNHHSEKMTQLESENRLLRAENQSLQEDIKHKAEQLAQKPAPKSKASKKAALTPECLEAIGAFDAKINTLGERLSILEHENGQLKTENQELREKMRSNGSQSAQLVCQEMFTAKESTCSSDFEKAVHDFDTQITLLSARLTQFENENRLLKIENQQLRDRLNGNPPMVAKPRAADQNLTAPARRQKKKSQKQVSMRTRF